MHLIVDAFNVLHAWATGPSSGGSTEVGSLAGLIGQSRYGSGRVSIVCDGAPFPIHNHDKSHSIRILFAGGGKEADPVIESLISRDTAPRRLTVASSDRRLQKAARKRGSRSLTSEAFLSQIIRDSATPAAKPLRPPFASTTPLPPEAVRQWLAEFDISADFAGPSASTPPTTPRRNPTPSPKPSHPKHPRSNTPPHAPPPSDPLLREALEHWQGRLSAADLDMARWLDEYRPS